MFDQFRSFEVPVNQKTAEGIAVRKLLIENVRSASEAYRRVADRLVRDCWINFREIEEV